jgi:hypothetical protein
MKSLDLELLASVGTTYDQTRTTLQGYVTQRTVEGTSVLGPSPSRFVDVFSDTLGAVTPTTTFFASENNRLFILGAVSTALLPIVCYEFNPSTGQFTYVGRLNMRLPNSPAIVHTIRSLKVQDTAGTTGWKIFVIASGTVLFSGSGTLMANKIDRADFVQVVPPNIEFANGSDQKAVYQLTRRATTKGLSVNPTLGTPVKFTWASHGFSNNDQVILTSQVGPAWTTSTFALNTKYFVRNAGTNDFELSASFGGASIGAAAGPTSVVIQEINQEIDAAAAILNPTADRLYTHVGSSTSHQYFVRDTSTAPVYIPDTVGISIGTPAKITLTGHSYVSDEPVMFLAGTLPTSFVLNTTYYVKNPTANDFELASTANGTSINATSAGTGITMGRPFGFTNSNWVHKTSILPTLSGIIFATDAERHALVQNSPINGPILNGQTCAFFATGGTGATMYVGLLSELTSETLTWPSLTPFNYNGALNQFIAYAPFTASWAESIDRAIFVAGATAATAYRIILKKIENNVVTHRFGGTSLEYYETTTRSAYQLELSAPMVNFTNQSGWLFIAGNTIGQRGLLACDLRSDSEFDYSYIVSKVVTIPNNAQLKSLKLLKKLANISGEVEVCYRLSGFGSISGGWLPLDPEADLSSIVVGSQIQFKFLFKTQSVHKTTHVQVAGAQIAYETVEEISDKWEYSFNDSSSGTPTRVGFRLKQTYQSAIPLTLRFRAMDLSGTVVANQTITSNPTNFQYSTDNGATWLALGTIPNTVGTLVRYTFTSPPGVDVRPTLKDS